MPVVALEQMNELKPPPAIPPVIAVELIETRRRKARSRHAQRDRVPTLAELKAALAAGASTALAKAEANTVKLIRRKEI